MGASRARISFFGKKQALRLFRDLFLEITVLYLVSYLLNCAYTSISRTGYQKKETHQ